MVLERGAVLQSLATTLLICLSIISDQESVQSSCFLIFVIIGAVLFMCYRCEPVHGEWAIRRAELADSETSMTAANDLAVRRALEAAGVEFIDENGGGPGVRLRKGSQKKR
jgi:hypothetical protein